MAADNILNLDQSSTSGHRHWLWLLGAFASGFAMLPLATACFYLPIPFRITLLIATLLYATPVTYPLVFAISAFCLRHKNRPEKYPGGGTIFFVALGQTTLIIAGAVLFYLMLPNIPLVLEPVVVVAP